MTFRSLQYDTSPNDPHRGENILDAIYDHVHFDPDRDEDCWHCGGEGYTFDCIDGCCVDAESGCEDCARRCPECVKREARIAKRVRIEVLKALDVDVAIAWLKKVDRWNEGFTRDDILTHLHAARAGCAAFTPEERADSGCWVEGLL